jgi:hypothetical protein
MTGTNCDLFTHKSSRSYLNHLVFYSPKLRCYVDSVIIKAICLAEYQKHSVKRKKDKLYLPERTQINRMELNEFISVRCDYRQLKVQSRVQTNMIGGWNCLVILPESKR